MLLMQQHQLLLGWQVLLHQARSKRQQTLTC
jgi:hypothetical protein